MSGSGGPPPDDAALVEWAKRNPWEVLRAAGQRGWRFEDRAVLCEDEFTPTGRTIVEAVTPDGNKVHRREFAFGRDPDPDPDGTGAARFLAVLEGVEVEGRPVLALLAGEAQGRPADLRPDPILPAIRWVGEAPEREAGRRLFGLIPDPAPQPSGMLPLFPRAPEALIRRVPLLALADATGTPVTSRGRGAPLDLRLAVETFLGVAFEARAAESVRVAFTVRDLRDALFPGGWTRRSGEGRPDDWARVTAALLRAQNRMIPIPGGGYWLPISLQYWPGPAATLDDVVSLQVTIPPGAGAGPIIDRPALRKLGVVSGPRYRAYLAVEAANWIPGRTRVRYPRSHRIGWAANSARYPVFTLADRRALAFGPTDGKNRTRAEVDGAFEALPGAEILEREAVDPQTGAKGWRIVPEAAANAIRKRVKGGNRGV